MRDRGQARYVATIKMYSCNLYNAHDPSTVIKERRSKMEEREKEKEGGRDSTRPRHYSVF